VFLPGYPPDFGPIEAALSKVKKPSRRARARSFRALVEVTGGASFAASERRRLGFLHPLWIRDPAGASTMKPL